MLPEHAVVFDPNDVVGIIWVVLFEMQQYFQLDASLVLELLFISDDLQGNDFFGLVVDALECLPKGALTEEVQDLEPVSNMILQDDAVIASFVIIAEIVLLLSRALDLLGSDAQEVALSVIEDFTLFVFSETWPFQVMLEHLGA